MDCKKNSIQFTSKELKYQPTFAFLSGKGGGGG